MSTTDVTAGVDREAYDDGLATPDERRDRWFRSLAAAQAAAEAVRVTDTDSMIAQLRGLRGRTHNLVMDDRLSHTQAAAVAALTDALQSAISAALVLKAVTS